MSSRINHIFEPPYSQFRRDLWVTHNDHDCKIRRLSDTCQIVELLRPNPRLFVSGQGAGVGVGWALGGTGQKVDPGKTCGCALSHLLSRLSAGWCPLPSIECANVGSFCCSVNKTDRATEWGFADPILARGDFLNNSLSNSLKAKGFSSTLHTFDGNPSFPPHPPPD